MKCSYTARFGSIINVDGNNVYLKSDFLQENCTLVDIIAIRYSAPSFWTNGSIQILTKKLLQDAQRLHIKKPPFYIFTFLKNNTAIYEAFYQELIEELRACHGSFGVAHGQWWTWPEDETFSKSQGESAVEHTEITPQKALNTTDKHLK